MRSPLPEGTHGRRRRQVMNTTPSAVDSRDAGTEGTKDEEGEQCEAATAFLTAVVRYRPKNDPARTEPGTSSQGSRMTAEGLNTQYRLQLAEDLTPPISRQTSELAWYYVLREATKRAGGTLETCDDETWIWSDLHLGDDTAMEHGNRPFYNVEAMNAALLEAWQACVEPGHTIVNLGDVTCAMTPWRKKAGTLRALPGRKIVVLGNHDFTGRGG